MCGIAGFFLPSGASKDATASLRRMCDQIRHRGPDDEGLRVEDGCGIGMRRLSIIDLNTGHQPISNEDGTIWVVFNGEIYNYRNLRRDLESKGHRFQTQTDTEVLVHLYEDEGVAGIARLQGMFTYALWDSHQRKLLLVRDRFGKKPLYYTIRPEGIYFGSELKCLRAAGIPLGPLNAEALRLYFQFTYIPEPHSIFEQVHKLPPAGWLTFDANGSVRQGRYWKLPVPATEPPSDLTKAQAIAELRERFDAAVSSRMVADVPIGAFLSGGVDSGSVVASLALQSEQPVRTFAIGFEESEFDELPYAQAIADRYHTEHHTLVVRPDSINLVEKLVHHFDEPFADSSAIPTYLVSKFAAEHVKVALTGDGGDEIFAGYDSFFQIEKERRWDRVPQALRRLAAAVSAGLPRKAYGRNYLYGISRPTSLERYFQFNYSMHWISGALFEPQWRTSLDEASLRRAFGDNLLTPQTDVLTEALYFEATAKLTGDMLVKVDRMSMAASLEVRCPMLDLELVEFAARLPHAWKMEGGLGKSIFIKAMGDRLPESTWNRPKHGFSVPIANWFRGPLRSLLHDHLLSKQFLDRGLVSPTALRQILAEHDSGRRNHRTWLWTLLMAELWFRAWQDTPKVEHLVA